jgi:hypothetical protein
MMRAHGRSHGGGGKRHLPIMALFLMPRAVKKDKGVVP